MNANHFHIPHNPLLTHNLWDKWKDLIHSGSLWAAIGLVVLMAFVLALGFLAANNEPENTPMWPFFPPYTFPAGPFGR